MNTFDFENHGIQGVNLTVVREPLHSLCASDAEVDRVIQNLKDDLDRVAQLMKSAIKQNAKESPL